MPFHPKPLEFITIDTSTLVSGASISNTPPDQIIAAWRNEQLQFALCEPILAEVAEVLTRPYFASRIGWTPQTISAYISDLRVGSKIVPITRPIQAISRDPNDNIIFACALEAGASIIISSDKDITSVGEYQGIPTMTPREFVDNYLSIAA